MTRLTRIADRIKSRFDRSDWRGLAKDLLIPALFVMVVAAPMVAGCMKDDTPEPRPAAAASPIEAGSVADRVFYANGGTREWGTLCRFAGGYVSVEHVTRNGIPVVGPRGKVVASSELSDWSLIGIDPMDHDPAAVPVLAPGVEVEIAGFPARDLDGEVLPGRVYLDDTAPPFVWIELLPLPGGGPPEGAVGGQSGSCVLVGGEVAGVVSANGFSAIKNTTSTWVLVVPMTAILREARGESALQKPSSFLPDTRPRPQIAVGGRALRPE